MTEHLAKTTLCYMYNKRHDYSLLAWEEFSTSFVKLEVWRRLAQAGLLNIKSDNPDFTRIVDGGDLHPHDVFCKVAENEDRAHGGRVAASLMTDIARTIPELILLYAAMDAGDGAAQAILPGVISMLGVGECNIFAPISTRGPGVNVIDPKLCDLDTTYPVDRGRLWLALSMMADLYVGFSPIWNGDDDTIGDFTVAGNKARSFRNSHAQLCTALVVDKYDMWGEHTEEVFLAVERAMAKAWIHNLVVLPTRDGPLTQLVDCTTGVKFQPTVGPWGIEVRSQPGCSFAIHFGFHQVGNENLLRADVVVVSDKAVKSALQELFPGETKYDGLRLLRSRYPKPHG
ncbi:hypothetical protein QBC34DRAFT_386145 [Podospora aff. communis PSN243]|uniref:Uncharacterized protein n=1 Tax=Podospora aff. communis PSN243 TaxID=3040156 RepID=A0AAV9G7V5_9PEZI|nr:hypothetical protein QBC34DRAFT_386145 [Podospora aff. communis PSN243]